ncbi:MAG: AAA family ATPase [Desulfamplus sp.]|nr:AAA family ATPase [Desulfamplus sp.]
MSIFTKFGLNGNPFSESVTGNDILMDGRFQSVFDQLELLPQVGSMGSLTGRTGVGKTTLLKMLISSWRTLNDVYYLHLGNLQNIGLIRAILKELGELPRLGKDRMFEQLYANLSRKQRPLCLILDEAQLLETRSMTDIRIMCGHLDFANRLIIVFSGQPALNTTLNAETLTDLRERMNIQCHLPSMSLPETIGYVEYRLEKAGASKSIFEEGAIKLMHHHGEGVPRRINQVAIKALMNAYSTKQKNVTEKIMREACASDRS